jgi:hypothetical protein
LPVHLNWQRPPSLPRKLRSWRRDVCRLYLFRTISGVRAPSWRVTSSQATSYVWKDCHITSSVAL